MSFEEKIKKLKIVEDLKDFPFQKKLINIWNVAEDEIHPFQTGDSYQSSRHCYNVLENLSQLVAMIELTKLDKYLLCCAAIIHDVDKAIIDYDRLVKNPNKHGVISADFIITNRVLFGFSRPEAEAVSIIVRHHGDKDLLKIKEQYPPNRISEPEAYSEFNEVDYPKLSAMFKLSDMMDMTYKRISEPIINLNFKEKPYDPKILARLTLSDSETTNESIILKTYAIDTFEKYQAVIIAVDMMNQELQESGADVLLKENDLPDKFELKAHPIENNVSLIKKREEISIFNDRQRLTLKEDKSEDELIKIYDEFSKDIEFSPGELKQINIKYKDLYSTVTEKPIIEISREFKNLFGYSISQLNITRKYNLDGSIECFISYERLEKPKQMPIYIVFTAEESAKEAKFDRDYTRIEKPEGLPGLDPGNITYKSESFAEFRLSNPQGYNYVPKLSFRFKVNSAWCIKKELFSEIYPGDEDICEEFWYRLTYPICKLKFSLEFPATYRVAPYGKYKFRTKFIDLLMKSDTNKNTFSFEILQQDIDLSFKEYPEYIFRWDISD